MHFQFCDLVQSDTAVLLIDYFGMEADLGHHKTPLQGNILIGSRDIDIYVFCDMSSVKGTH